MNLSPRLVADRQDPDLLLEDALQLPVLLLDVDDEDRGASASPCRMMWKAWLVFPEPVAPRRRMCLKRRRMVNVNRVAAASSASIFTSASAFFALQREALLVLARVVRVKRPSRPP